MSALRHKSGIVGFAALFLTGAVFWSAFHDSGGVPASESKIATQPPLPELAQSVASAPFAAGREPTSDGIRLMRAGSTDNSSDGPRHPHPITPTHERNFRQINIVSAIDGAMDVRDFDELRRMNRAYRAEYPEGRIFQEGYDLIADCQEQRTEQTRAAAERYWNDEVASNLRRYVRRYCLD